MTSVAVIGGGAWGTALALVAAGNGCATTLWVRDPATARHLTGVRENPRLPGVALPAALRITAELERVRDAAVWVLAVPAQALGAVCQQLARLAAAPRPLVIAAKGIEVSSGRLMSQLAGAALGGFPLAILSGPTFADEVAAGKPTAVSVAVDRQDVATADIVTAAFGTAVFRPYVSFDPVGVQVGGAVKNIVAIACGISQGRGLGENARAAIITRGLSEASRLAVALGGRADTLLGLAGVGDLSLTCTSLRSRNMALGQALGEGGTLREVLRTSRGVVEGVESARAVVVLADRLGVDMPICQAVCAILHDTADIDATIRNLLMRPFTAESDAHRPSAGAPGAGPGAGGA
ncbi:MAG: NAD(P)H-dependent glycerol-3-phosphate dehydrogenase, partial [Alphaproteobacteria bacterium]